MVWKIEYASSVEDSLRKLGKETAKRILHFMETRVATAENPRNFGKSLIGSFGGLWRYRVGDCRVICNIEDKTLCVLVV